MKKKNAGINYIDCNNIPTDPKTHEDPIYTIGERIRNCRLAIGLSIEEFAKELGKSYEYVVAYENNRRNPKDETLDKMADILKTSPEFLKHGFMTMCHTYDDKVFELEYRERPLDDFDDSSYIDAINKSIKVIEKTTGKTKVNYLQVLADISMFLSATARLELFNPEKDKNNKSSISKTKKKVAI